MLKELSWDPFEGLPARLAARQLRTGLVFTFDRPIQVELVKRCAQTAVEVWLRTNEDGTPVRGVRGIAQGDGEQVIWTADDNAAGMIMEFAAQLGGRLVIDLNCDVVLDDQGQPASASWTSLFGTHRPRPGGIMRTWLEITPG